MKHDPYDEFGNDRDLYVMKPYRPPHDPWIMLAIGVLAAGVILICAAVALGWAP